MTDDEFVRLEAYCKQRSNDANHFAMIAAKLEADNARLRAALRGLEAFVAVMVGRGADATIPETINSPIGVPIKVGAIMREARAALEQKP